MNKPIIPDADESRAGFRSGEGTESVLRHLAAARRKQKGPASSPEPSQTPPSEERDGKVDVSLPP